MAFDPTPPAQPSPQIPQYRTPRGETRDYFSSPKIAEHVRKPSGGTPTSPVASPHIAYQEKGRLTSDEIIGSIKRRHEGSFSVEGSVATSPVVGTSANREQYAASPNITQSYPDAKSKERFKLEEVPKTKKSGSSSRSSRSGPISLSTGTLPTFTGLKSTQNQVGEMLGGNVAVVQEPESFVTQNVNPSHSSQDYRPRGDGSMDSSRSARASTVGQTPYPPKRGDSLESSKLSQPIPRKEVSSGPSKSQHSPKTRQGSFSAFTTTNVASEHVSASEKMNGSKVVSRQMESPLSTGNFDTSLSKKSDAPASSWNGSFIARRPPPSPPSEATKARNESFSTSQSETLKLGDRSVSPGLPRWSAGGEFSMDEDMARILGAEDSQGHESFLRRVSNSVRHGRSFSDKGMRSSREPKWPRSPIANSTLAGQDVSSSSTASAEHRDELAWVKNELRRERQKTLEREERILELESAMHSTANIKQVNSELREKRSTIVVLDTQKELVVRELEILTEHIATAKRTGDPLDLSKMSHAVMREFAESLQKLKDSFAPQIEDSVQKRNDLVDELSSLTQMKDKSFQEFEQLSLKNAQLAELNNQLVHQIQELYKATSTTQVEQSRAAPNGLGIYSHHKDKSQISIESRDLRSNTNEISMMSSGTTLQQEEAEPVSLLQGPHVVNIRKGQPRKFNWKKGGQNVAKGVTKGIKGAFSSTQASYSREMQFAETMPYGSTPPSGSDQANNMLRHGTLEAPRPGFGLFGGNQKVGPKGHQPWKSHSNGSSPALTVDASTSRSFLDWLNCLFADLSSTLWLRSRSQSRVRENHDPVHRDKVYRRSRATRYALSPSLIENHTDQSQESTSKASTAKPAAPAKCK